VLQSYYKLTHIQDICIVNEYNNGPISEKLTQKF